MYIFLWENSRGHPDNVSFMQFSTKIDGFEQKDSQGFENSYNSYEQYPLENFFIFTIYQNYTLALSQFYKCIRWHLIFYVTVDTENKLHFAFIAIWIRYWTDRKPGAWWSETWNWSSSLSRLGHVSQPDANPDKTDCRKI